MIAAIERQTKPPKGSFLAIAGWVILSDRHCRWGNETAKRVILSDRGVGHSS
jgi:hypothetical protein